MDLAVADHGDAIDGNERFRLTHAEEAAVFDEQKSDLVLLIVDEQVFDFPEVVAILVLDFESAMSCSELDTVCPLSLSLLRTASSGGLVIVDPLRVRCRRRATRRGR